MTSSTLDSAPTTTQRLELRVDESSMSTAYANAIRTTPAAEEVVLDFGMSLPSIGGTGRPAQVFTIHSRVVVNWSNAKRFAMGLAQMVQAYEQQNGAIQVAPPAGSAGKR